ncbi:MAG TPA: ankyrin repeat domain-containing protein, partial [Armatimonadota bacterium]|nr:ankyrin repeat domain-containing protein [Armatimonadota bacterium]
MALTRRRRCVIAAAAISLVGIATAWHLYTSSNIHRAVKYGSTLAVRRAINAGADVNAPRGDDYPPLAVAAARGHVGICRLLLDSGARVHAGLGLGMDMTAIQFAAGCEVYSGDFCGSIYAEKAPPNAIEVCRLLIEHGATRTSVRQAATWAALAGEPELLAFLLDSGPLPAREPGVCSLLEAAIDSGSPETVEVLLDRMDSPAEAAADRQQV